MISKKEQIDKLLKKLENDDPDVQDDAIKQLEVLGGRLAVITLVELLDKNEWRQAKGFDPDWRGPQGERLEGRNVYEPLSFLAAKALACLIPDPPVSSDEPFITTEHVNKWQTWWAANKGHYLEGDASS